jgi:CheY-like chemotaxis protein
MPLDPSVREWRALLVEDHEDTRALYAEHLRKEGWIVEDVPSGLDALAIAPVFAPDVVVVDVAMPDLDGIELTKRLRKLASTVSVPIVVLTAYRAYDIEAYDAGCSAFVTKPCSPQALLGALESVLTQARTVRSSRPPAYRGPHDAEG